MRLASLPMYDLEELRPATDAWWQGLEQAFRRLGLDEAPDGLMRDMELGGHWHDPALLLSQTCGYPLTHGLKGAVTLVATPIYEAPGCSGANYSSVILVRDGDAAGALADLAGRTCAFNAKNSQSGYNALRSLVAPLAGGSRFFAETLASGGHLASMEAVRDGRADVAAVDCVTYALFARSRPAVVQGLRILQRSPAAPALPYITSAKEDPEVVAKLREGLKSAIGDPRLEAARQSLLLKDFAFLPDHAYVVIDDMEQEAVSLGYAELV